MDYRFSIRQDSKVILNGNASNSTNVISGVPQGSVFGPLLFIIYINDLPDKLSSQFNLYADDALLIHTIADIHILLNALDHWASTWPMAFNPSKCEFLQITKKLSLLIPITI